MVDDQLYNKEHIDLIRSYIILLEHAIEYYGMEKGLAKFRTVFEGEEFDLSIDAICDAYNKGQRIWTNATLDESIIRYLEGIE